MSGAAVAAITAGAVFAVAQAVSDGGGFLWAIAAAAVAALVIVGAIDERRKRRAVKDSVQG